MLTYTWPTKSCRELSQQEDEQSVDQSMCLWNDLNKAVERYQIMQSIVVESK